MGQAGEDVELEADVVVLLHVEAETVVVLVMLVLPEQGQELAELVPVVNVAEDVLLRHLPGLLYQNSKCIFISFEQLMVVVVICGD